MARFTFAHPGLTLELPSLYEDSGAPRLVVGSWEMRAARDLDALIASVEQRVRAAS